MNLKFPILIMLCGTLSIKLVVQQPLDTLFVNENQNVAVLFPNSIKSAITGDSGFVVSYNRDKAERLALLQGLLIRPAIYGS